MIRVTLASPAALVAFAGEGVAAGVKTRDAAEGEALQARAKSGEAFLLVTDDPGLASFHLYVDEPVPEELERAYAARSGSFLLRLPSGRLGVCGVGTESPETGEPPEVHTLEVPPGDYAVSLLDGFERDVAALTEQEKALVDPADWRLHERVNQLGAAGCLAVAGGMVFVLVPYTRRELWFLLPLFLLPSAGFSLLKRLPAYRRVEERLGEYERRLPQLVLVLQRVASTEGLSGGWYRC